MKARLPYYLVGGLIGFGLAFLTPRRTLREILFLGLVGLLLLYLAEKK